MSLQVRQLEQHLRGMYGSLIELTDVASASEEHRAGILRTRALAAFALSLDAGIDPETAAASVIDGPGDNGLDAVYVDRTVPTIYLVQSKWHANGHGSIDVGDTLKALVGLQDLTDLSFERFSGRLDHLADEIRDAIEDPNLRIRLIFATTGVEDIAEPAQVHIRTAEQEFNLASEMLSDHLVDLRRLHPAIASGVSPLVGRLDFSLREWGRIGEPFEAYFGLVDVRDVAAWYREHGDALFSLNIRRGLGNTNVNESIVNTLQDNLDSFWYFNNGVTVLCESVQKTAQGGNSRESGNFVALGVSVVNGAQTVQSIARALSRGRTEAPAADMGLDSATASVWVRFISLEDCPDGFAFEVTRATNTQNTVEARDFVALDDVQQRLRQDMTLTLRKVYAIKRGDTGASGDNGCSVTEATIALACLDTDSTRTVLAKSAIGRLWEPIDRAPYRALFNQGTSVFRLWRAVEVMRKVDETLIVERRSLVGREQAVAIQGNRMVLHLVFRRLDTSDIDSESADWEQKIAQVPGLTRDALRDVIDLVQSDFPTNYITSLFKNAAKCREIVKALSLPRDRAKNGE